MSSRWGTKWLVFQYLDPKRQVTTSIPIYISTKRHWGERKIINLWLFSLRLGGETSQTPLSIWFPMSISIGNNTKLYKKYFIGRIILFRSIENAHTCPWSSKSTLVRCEDEGEAISVFVSWSCDCEREGGVERLREAKTWAMSSEWWAVTHEHWAVKTTKFSK